MTVEAEGQGVGNDAAEAEGDAPTMGIETPETGSEEIEPVPEPEKPTDRELELSEKFNLVTERERVLRESEETNKSSAAELAANKEIFQKFKDNPLEGLRALGIDFKDVANLVINDEQPTAEMQVKKLRDEIESRENESREAKEKSEQDAQAEAEKLQTDQQDRAVATAREQIKTLVDDNPEKFELIKQQDAYDLVFDIAGQMYEKTKVLPAWEEVAAKVESQISEEMEKYYETNHFKSRYQKIPEKISHDDERDMEANYYGHKMIEEKYGRSLNNQMTADGAKPANSNDFRTDEESKAYLAAKLTRMMQQEG